VSEPNQAQQGPPAVSPVTQASDPNRIPPRPQPDPESNGSKAETPVRSGAGPVRQPRRYVRRAESTTCTCGWVGLAGRLKSVHHQQSAVHVHAEQIKELLGTNRITFQEIGRRFGITRERVRQIAAALGFPPGRSRPKAHRPRASAEAREARRAEMVALQMEYKAKWDLIVALKADCPYEVDLAGQDMRFREVLIQGVLCQLGQATSRGTLGYTHLEGLKGAVRAKVLLMKLPKAGWLVIPREKYRRGNFRLGVSGQPHEYDRMVNNWKLLEVVANGRAAEPSRERQAARRPKGATTGKDRIVTEQVRSFR
jgi:Sigma-70, region 4